MTSSTKDLGNLKEDIKEQKEFTLKGFERIKKYYTLQLDKRQTETGLSIPPHELLLERSAEIIELGLYRILDFKDVNEGLQGAAEVAWPGFDTRVKGFHRFDYILIGIGTEILLKAILLKEEPDFIINYEKFDKQKTPLFGRCKEKVIDILRCKLSSTHLERAEDILELILLKRNNLAHLNFHCMSNYKEDYEVANVLRFLFLYFFKAESSKIVAKLEIVKKETKITFGSYYELVEFDGYI